MATKHDTKQHIDQKSILGHSFSPIPQEELDFDFFKLLFFKLECTCNKTKKITCYLNILRKY